MNKQNVILIMGILLVLIYIIYIVLYARRKLTPNDLYSDIPPEPFESQPKKGPFANSQDYAEFYSWHSNFCTTWGKVIEQSMSVDNYKGSPTDYVTTLEEKNNKKLVKCYTEITADPEDPLQIVQKIPTVDLYLSTMNFMASRISSILEKTKNALAGKPMKEESFANPSTGQCACLTPDIVASLKGLAATESKKAEEDLARQKALKEILAQIKPIVKDRASLQGQLDIIIKGLQELITYKQKAESGEIAKDVQIPS
jgi:hypothetical protein